MGKATTHIGMVLRATVWTGFKAANRLFVNLFCQAVVGCIPCQQLDVGQRIRANAYEQIEKLSKRCFTDFRAHDESSLGVSACSACDVWQLTYVPAGSTEKHMCRERRRLECESDEQLNVANYAAHMNFS